MKPLVVITGDTYGSLTIVKETTPGIGGRSYYRRFIVRCECGSVTTVALSNLQSRATQHCAPCQLRSMKNGNPRRTHGKRWTSEYGIWKGMKARCHNPKHISYPYYGALGITVCGRWTSSFSNFLADVGYRPSREYTLDRIDPSGNYDSENVRWATWSVQRENRNKV